MPIPYLNNRTSPGPSQDWVSQGTTGGNYTSPGAIQARQNNQNLINSTVQPLWTRPPINDFSGPTGRSIRSGGGGNSYGLGASGGPGGLSTGSVGGTATYGNPTPAFRGGTGSGRVSATSTGTGFGTLGPDLSGLPPDQLRSIMGNLGRLTYNLQGGGYRFNDVNYAGNLPGNFTDDAANRLASQTYGRLGSLPTRTYGSLALERLYQSSGIRPSQGPSLTQRLGQPYQGSWTMPGYNPFGV